MYKIVRNDCHRITNVITFGSNYFQIYIVDNTLRKHMVYQKDNFQFYIPHSACNPVALGAESLPPWKYLSFSN